jgi:uncharacterized protein YcbX
MDDFANNWFTEVLGYPVRLMRVGREKREEESREKTHESCEKKNDFQSHRISFANQGPFLLVCDESVRFINALIANGMQNQEEEEKEKGKRGGEREGGEGAKSEKPKPLLTVHNFRPNFVIKGGSPLDEDSWTSLCISSFTGSQSCGRYEQGTPQAPQGGQDLCADPDTSRCKSSLAFTVDEDCRRCAVINVDLLGHKNKSIFQWLLNYRKSRGGKEAHFGRYVSLDRKGDIQSAHSLCYVQVNSGVTIMSES